MNKKNKIKLGLGIVIAIFSITNICLAQKDAQKVMLTLCDLEKEAKADDGEVDYEVPDQNNKPAKCTLLVIINGDASATEGAIHIGGNKYQVPGIENFCRDAAKGTKPTGCSPYNCHQRIPTI